MALPLLLALQTAPSFDLQSIVLEGDVVPGVGAVTRIDNITIQNGGAWFVEVDTDAVNTDADSALLTNGGLPVLQEGQPLAEPVGTTLDSFDSIQLDDLGRTSFNHFLDGAVTNSDDSAIYSGDAVLVREGDLAPSSFSAGSTYAGFFETKRSGGDFVLALVTVDDPLLSTGLDRAILRFEVDANDTVLGVDSVSQTGDVLPGQTEPIDDMVTNPHSLAMNRAGAVIYVANLEGDTATDHAVVVGGAVVAQEGQPSPIPGRNWEFLSSSRVDLNNDGLFVYSGNLDGDSSDDNAIFLGTQLIAREGDPVPGGIAPGSTITSLGSGPVLINDAGEVLYFASWGSGTGALFLNDTPLVVQGVTQVGGQTINQLRGVQDGYAMSRSGGYILFEGIFTNGDEGAFLLTREGSTVSLPGCSSLNPATLAATGVPTIGAPLPLTASGSSFSLAAGVLAISGSALTPILLPCGTVLPGLGEVYVDPGPGLLTVTLPTYTGSPVSVNLTIPNKPSLVGASAYAQAVFVDLSTPIPSTELSGGLRLDIGG